MKTTTLRILAACLLLPGVSPARGQAPQPSARKFDEFTEFLGRHYSEWYREQEEKDRKARFKLYAAQLRKEGARPYAITYGPRVVTWEGYGRPVADRLASGLWPHLTGLGIDGHHINWVDGGFREHATTELWVVPPGASPPCPTPTVRPEDVAYCPSVYVRGSTYVPAPSGPISFKATVSVEEKRVSPTFAWQVSQGRIVGGQGTDTITVELPARASGMVTASVVAQGYSLECPSNSIIAFSQTMVGVSHFKVDEFGDIRMGDTKARLDNFAIELQNDPTLRGYIIVYGARQGPRGQAERRAAQLKHYLSDTRGIDASRLTTIVGGFRNELSGELWLSTSGAPPPPTRPTIDEGYVTPKGDVRRRP